MKTVKATWKKNLKNKNKTRITRKLSIVAISCHKNSVNAISTYQQQHTIYMVETACREWNNTLILLLVTESGRKIKDEIAKNIWHEGRFSYRMNAWGTAPPYEGFLPLQLISQDARSDAVSLPNPMRQNGLVLHRPINTLLTQLYFNYLQIIL